MPFVPAKCTQCGANLEVDPARDAAICSACGTPFVVEKAIQNYNTTINVQTVVVQQPSSDFEIRAGVLVKYHGAAVDVIVPEGVVEIGEGVFRDCSGLKSVVLPKDLQAVLGSAFEKCGALAKIEIPDTVNYIGSRAFEGCTMLKTITLPPGIYSVGFTSRNVGTIGYRAFAGCPIKDVFVHNPIFAKKELAKFNNEVFEGYFALKPHPAVKDIQRWNWVMNGKCQYCGGEIKYPPLLSSRKPKCKSCGKEKIY